MSVFSSTPIDAPPVLAQAAAASPSRPVVVGPPPEVTVPGPPPGFVAPGASKYLGYIPTTHELAEARTAIADLRKFSDYGAVLGSAAPDAAAVASAIEIGMQWRQMRPAAAMWDAYVRAQNGMAWRVALTLLSELKPLFRAAAAKDPGLLTTYQGLAGMLEAPKVVAKQSAATRRKRKRAKDEQAQATDQAAPAAVAPVEAPATHAKTITVNV